jgi:hypothetical protein
MTLATTTATQALAPTTTAGPGPEQILQMATGYWVSKTLFTGLELGVFETLDERPRSPRELAEILDLPYDSSTRLVTALAALGLLERRGDRFATTPSAAAFLVKSSPHYMAGMFDHFDHDLYPLWRYLSDAVREGTSRWQQAFGPDANPNPFETIYRDPAALRGFLRAMDSLLMPVALELREQFDFSPYRCLLDVGGAWGTLPLLLLERYPDLRAIVFDLPPVGPIAQEHIAAADASARVEVQTGDMFDEPLPRGADLIVLGWILHDWDDAGCELLLRRCFEALPSGGHILLLEMVLDEDRTGPLFPALMSLNMLVATLNGRERTGNEFRALLERAGFVEPRVQQLHGPRDYVLARKP